MLWILTASELIGGYLLTEQIHFYFIKDVGFDGSRCHNNKMKRSFSQSCNNKISILCQGQKSHEMHIYNHLQPLPSWSN